MKKRRLAQLQAELDQAQRKLDEPAPPRLCFGSRKLFNAQHHPEANGYSSHAEWQADWNFARHSQFFLIGSKDETAGNQSCQYDPATQAIKLRLTETLAEEQGVRHSILEEVSFPYGQEKIEAALESSSAISYRFVARKEKDETVNWYLKATLEETASPLITSAERGVLGVDLNANQIAIGEVAPDGNPLGEALASRARSPSLHTTLMEARTQSEGKHVWSGWSVVKKRLGRNRRVWPGRCPEKGVGGGREAIGGKALVLSADRTPRAGESPAASRESCSPGAMDKQVVLFVHISRNGLTW